MPYQTRWHRFTQKTGWPFGGVQTASFIVCFIPALILAPVLIRGVFWLCAAVGRFLMETF